MPIFDMTRWSDSSNPAARFFKVPLEEPASK
jgi:hypothetical protein